MLPPPPHNRSVDLHGIVVLPSHHNVQEHFFGLVLSAQEGLRRHSHHTGSEHAVGIFVHMAVFV